MLGTNDWGHATPLDQFSSAYGSFLDSVTWLRDRVYCVTPLWRANENQPNAAGLFLQEYRDAIARVCATLPQAVTVDGLQLVPADPSYFVDGLHPNARGNVLMARRLAAIFSTTLPATAPASADEPFP
jgi:lysophospholipase L1-like esterase